MPRKPTKKAPPAKRRPPPTRRTAPPADPPPKEGHALTRTTADGVMVACRLPSESDAFWRAQLWPLLRDRLLWLLGKLDAPGLTLPDARRLVARAWHETRAMVENHDGPADTIPPRPSSVV